MITKKTDPCPRGTERDNHAHRYHPTEVDNGGGPRVALCLQCGHIFKIRADAD